MREGRRRRGEGMGGVEEKRAGGIYSRRRV